MEVNNLSLIFRAIPLGLPIPGRHLTVEPRPISLQSTTMNSIITKNLFSSLDPYMRLMLIAADQKHYRAPFKLDEPLSSYGIAEIIVSKHPEYRVGSIIKTRLPIQQYSIFTGDALKAMQVEVLTVKSPLAAYLGPLGMPGLTAYSSVNEIGQPKAGETVFVSSAAGAVGQLAGQLCRLRGLRVIGSVGSEDKLKMIRELGFDDGFNYKTEKASSALARLCPQGIDIYFDNVGGEQLESAIGLMNKGGRIVVCGMISQYSKAHDQQYGVKNLFQFVAQGLTMRGFLIGDPDFGPKWKQSHQEDVTTWLEEGKIKAWISEAMGIESGAEAFKAMLEGKNKGKTVLKIWRDEEVVVGLGQEEFAFRDFVLD